MHKVIKKLRGGSLSEVAAIVIFIMIWSIMNILGFQPVSGVRSANGGINAVQRQINHPKQVSQITF
jgi:hypothetical protein